MTEVIYRNVWPLPDRFIASAMQLIETLTDYGFPRDLAIATADLVGNFSVDEIHRIERAQRLASRGAGYTDEITRPRPEIAPLALLVPTG